jgi:hypothetical protein
MANFAVQTYTLCQGWINCWRVDEQPSVFDSIKSAEKELADHLVDLAEAGMEPDQYRVVPCDYILRVGGTPSDGWLSAPSDEECPTDVIPTRYPENVRRYDSWQEAKQHLDALVAAHPTREFMIATLEALEVETA